MVMRSKKAKINHLFYMDDQKAYAMNDEQLKKLLDIIKIFSDDIKKEFGLDKCPKATFIKGKLKKHLILFSIKTPP